MFAIARISSESDLEASHRLVPESSVNDFTSLRHVMHLALALSLCIFSGVQHKILADFALGEDAC